MGDGDRTISEPDEQAFRDDLEVALAEVFSKHGRLVSKWVVIADGFGNEAENADRFIFRYWNEELRHWDVVGLLEYSLWVLRTDAGL